VHDTVSVLPRKLVEHPEALILSVVRLFRLDEVPVLVGEVPYPVVRTEVLGLADDRVFDCLGAEAVRTGKIGTIEGWVLSDGEKRELVDGIVQRGAAVIEEGAERARKLTELFLLDGWITETAERGLPAVTLMLTQMVYALASTNHMLRSLKA
jgi:hypothetical protein